MTFSLETPLPTISTEWLERVTANPFGARPLE